MTDSPLAAFIHRLRRQLAQPLVDTLSDAVLLERFIRRRDQDAFTALVRRHGPLVWRVCRRVLRHVQLAEDAYQATFLALAQQAAKIRKPEALASWLYGVAYRIACKTRADLTREHFPIPDAIPASNIDPAEAASWRELEHIIVEEVQALAEKYRLPILLCYWEGLTNAEAAVRLSWPEGTVKTRLLKARQLLHKQLTQRGVSLSAGAIVTLLAAGSGEAGVPPLLTASAIRLTGAFVTGNDGGISASVSALTEQAVQSVALSKIKIAFVLLLSSAIAAGAGAVAYHETPAQPPPEERAAQLPTKVKEAEQPKIRTDRYGDPLPEGAIARLGTVRFRHPFWVSGLAFTPDGKTLASSCWDGSVRFWDAATGKETRCFRESSKPMPGRGPTAFLGIALSPDGKTLVALTNHETKYIWDVASGKELHRLKGGNGFSLALSPDGKTVAAGDGDGKVRLWDLKSGKPMRSFKADGRPVAALAFSPDSKVLAAGDSAAIGAAQAEDGVSMVRLWDAATGRQLRELKGHTGGVNAVAFSPDGRTLISAGDDATLRFWDAATGKHIRKLQVPDETSIESLDQHKGINCGGVLAVAYSSDGRFLASGSYDGTVRLWDTDSGKELHALRGHGREVAGVVFSPDGKVLASGSRDHTIRLWDAGSGKPLQPRQGADGPVNDLAVSPDGRLAAAVCHDHTIRLWSLAAQRQLHVLRGHTDFVYAVAFSPDGRTLASGSADRTVRLWDAATGRELRRLGEHRFAVYSLAFTPEGNTLLSAEGDDTVYFWDATTGKELRRIPGIDSSSILQASSDGKFLATADRSAVHLLDGKTGKDLRRFGGTWPRFALSPDGRMLATQSTKEKIRLWNVATGEEIGVLVDLKPSPGFAGILSFMFSPDGRLLALVGKENDIELWEVLTGKLRRRFCGHQGGINPLAFAPAGKTLLSGSDDTTVLIWDVARSSEERSGLPSETQLQGFWRDLAGGDAEKADRAIHTLAATAKQSLPFLKRRVSPARIADEERLTRLIADLDSDRFSVRDRATQELERRGEGAETALRQALTKSPTLEARRRMENLLERLRGLPLSPDLLRSLRAVEVLEHIGTLDSQQVLKSLGNGAAQARLTREAKAALERLTKRTEEKHRP